MGEGSFPGGLKEARFCSGLDVVREQESSVIGYLNFEKVRGME